MGHPIWAIEKQGNNCIVALRDDFYTDRQPRPAALQTKRVVDTISAVVAEKACWRHPTLTASSLESCRVPRAQLVSGTLELARHTATHQRNPVTEISSALLRLSARARSQAPTQVDVSRAAWTIVYAYRRWNKRHEAAVKLQAEQSAAILTAAAGSSSSTLTDEVEEDFEEMEEDAATQVRPKDTHPTCTTASWLLLPQTETACY